MTELSSLYRSLPAISQQLVVLYAKALVLQQKQPDLDVRERMGLAAEVLGLDPQSLHRVDGSSTPSTKDQVDYLDTTFGVAQGWLLQGSTDALASRIVEFNRTYCKQPEQEAEV